LSRERTGSVFIKGLRRQWSGPEDGAAGDELVRTCRGDDALHRLEEIFYVKVLADPVLKSLFTERDQITSTT